MAVESNIDASDQWLAGEDKTLLFTVRGPADDLEAWTVEWTLYPAEGDPVPVTVGIQKIPADGIGDLPTIIVPVPAAATADLSTDLVHSYVLRRVDAGARTVLAHGAIAFGGAGVRA